MSEIILNASETDVLYERLRAKIEHEDGLVHERLTWMITLHGLLFTAYGFSLSAEATSLSAPGLVTSSSSEQRAAFLAFAATIALLRHAMIIVGMFSSLAALVGVVAAFRAIRDDESQFRLLRMSNPALYPKLIGRPAANILGMLSGLTLPFLAGGVWTWIGGFVPSPVIAGGGAVVVALLLLATWPLMSATRE